MYTKEQIWSSFAKELSIIKHLAEKIPGGQEHHKPTEKQRTTLELLQYLSAMGIGMLDAVTTGDTAVFGKYIDRSKNVTIENFADAIDLEEKEMKTIFEKLDENALSEEISLFGRTQSRALFILDHLKTMTGYKMQLFLYIKASGNEHIGTSNVWGGIDTPAKTA